MNDDWCSRRKGCWLESLEVLLVCKERWWKVCSSLACSGPSCVLMRRGEFEWEKFDVVTRGEKLADKSHALLVLMSLSILIKCDQLSILCASWVSCSGTSCLDILPDKSSLIGLGSARDYYGCAILHCSPFGWSSQSRHLALLMIFLSNKDF